MMQPQIDFTSTDSLFIHGVAENSNLEMDWLWLAEQVTSSAEKLYCYQKALYINPNCEEALRSIHAIQKANQNTNRFERVFRALNFLVARSAYDHLSAAE